MSNPSKDIFQVHTLAVGEPLDELNERARQYYSGDLGMTLAQSQEQALEDFRRVFDVSQYRRLSVSKVLASGSVSFFEHKERRP